jgi:hypothetical protein
MLGDGIFCALIRALCTDPHGLAENPDLLSYDGGFVQSFRGQMRGFQDMLRQNLSSLFILLGWTSISVTSLMIRSMCLGSVERMVVWCVGGCGAPS